MIAKEFPDKILVGAGTFMTIEQVTVAAGAKYIISPDFDKKVVARTIDF